MSAQKPNPTVPKTWRGAEAWNTRIVPGASSGANTLLSKFDA
jgi:hypothetical protein